MGPSRPFLEKISHKRHGRILQYRMYLYSVPCALGYNEIATCLSQVVDCCKIFTKYVFRFFEPLRPRLTSKFAKTYFYDTHQIFLAKCNLGIKKAKLDAKFEYDETFIKKVIFIKVNEILVFYLLFLWEKFGLEISVKFCVIYTHIKLL
jgi:hypothetical protein